jgi:hypothetical protein
MGQAAAFVGFVRDKISNRLKLLPRVKTSSLALIDKQQMLPPSETAFVKPSVIISC